MDDNPQAFQCHGANKDMKDRGDGYHSLNIQPNTGSIGTSGYSGSSYVFQPKESESGSTSGSVNSQTPYFLNYPKIAPIILPALLLTEQIRNAAIKKLTLQYLGIFQTVLVEIINGNRDIGYLPPLKMNIDDDGSVLLEWIFKDFRIGISFEVQESDSSWYLVSNKNMQEVSKSGSLSTTDSIVLIRDLVSYVISNT